MQEQFLGGNDTVATNSSRPRHVNRRQTSRTTEVSIFVSNGMPILMRQRVSFAVDVLQSTLHDKQNVGLFFQYQGMDRPGCFLDNVARARDPLVFEISPRATDGKSDHGTVMPMNSEITPGWAAQPGNPLSRGRVGMDELHFTSTWTVREPRSIIRGNVLRLECANLHMLSP